MYKSLSIPRLGWMSIQTHYPEWSTGSRWSHSRGRLTEHVWCIPLWRWDIELHGRGKTYRELTGLPPMSLDWILDEFDASFNDLAIASLRYHMDHSVVQCPPERRAHYQELVDRLSEEPPRFTDAELAILYPPGRTSEDYWEVLPNGLRRMIPQTPEEEAVHEALRERTAAYNERIRQARHDFVDIMPELWS
ncbi:hypothetical protein [Nocardia thailandica]|uniref:hypothetical protein n=1 Tax=Nocardia thailandica TaxID=257275 RepID=UPI00030D03F7|nr:hypothetical protein [Nocardia thailandica]